MSKDKSTATEKIPISGRTENKDRSPIRTLGSLHDWDFETNFPDPLTRHERIRASSWDDSDDDLPPVPDVSGSKACRIYSSDDKSLCVAPKISELKKEFFKGLEKEEDSMAESRWNESQNCDRRQSPARMRRRSRSSDSSSPILEMESQVSPHKINPSELQDFSPKALECDPSFYLNNFFAELRSKRISFIDPITMMENLGKVMPSCDRDSFERYRESDNLDANNLDDYLKTSRKLSQILEVEENRKDLERSSDENMPDADLFQKCNRTPEEDSSPLETSRSKKSEKTSEKWEESKRKKDRFKSLSSEHFKNSQKVQKPSQGSVSERAGRIFDRKLDDDFISLSAKTGKTQLTSPKSSNDGNVKTPISMSPLAPPVTSSRESPTAENTALKIDLTKNPQSGNATPRKSTDRSVRAGGRTRSGKSRRSSNAESPEFAINIGRDSERSLKVEDVNAVDSQRNDSEECSFRKNCTSEGRTERIPPIPLDSPSVESVISTRRSLIEQDVQTAISRNRNSSQRSHKKKRKQRSGNVESELKEPTESKEANLAIFTGTTETHSPFESHGRREKTRRTPRTSKTTNGETPTKCEHECTNTTRTPNFRTSRISKSPKSGTLRSAENRSVRPDQATPRIKKIPELDLRLDIFESPEPQKASHRSPKTPETHDTCRKGSDRSETSRRRTHRLSEHSTTPRSKNTGLKNTPRTHSGSSRRSKDSLENVESLRLVCDTASNHTSISSTSRKSWREYEIPSQQHSYRSEIYNPEMYISGVVGTLESAVKEGLKSRNSSRTSVESDMMDDNSPARSRPNSWTSKGYTISPDVEKLDPVSCKTNRSCISEEDEDLEDTVRKIEESDDLSNKRLSVINEVSLEDLGTSNVSTENEEKDVWDESRLCSRKNTKQTSPQSPMKYKSVKKTPDGSLGEKTSNVGKHEEEKWSELIKIFQGSSNSLILENNFPGFPREKDISWNSIQNSIPENKSADEISERNPFPRKKSRERKVSFEEKNLNDINSVYRDSLSEKTNHEEFPRSIHGSQSVYYATVGSPYGIGEFGDVTCWDTGYSDPKDIEKPKDHGDGIPMYRHAEVLAPKPEKKEREVKTLRQSWKDLLEDFRDSTQPLEVQDTEDYMHYIPCRLKASRSDNCINKKVSDVQVLETSFLNDEYKSEPAGRELLEGRGNTDKEMKFLATNSSSESLKGDSENLEFDYERTPRLSRSLSNLDLRLQENVSHRQPSETFSISGSPDSCKPDKEFPRLKIFLGRKDKDGKMAGKSNNWLKLRNPEEKSPSKRWKKTKTKFKKRGSTSPKEPFHSYLSSRKTRAPVPILKLRNQNCFQNFYKRFIGVFCLTSNSSAATSK